MAQLLMMILKTTTLLIVTLRMTMTTSDRMRNAETSAWLRPQDCQGLATDFQMNARICPFQVNLIGRGTSGAQGATIMRRMMSMMNR